MPGAVHAELFPVITSIETKIISEGGLGTYAQAEYTVAQALIEVDDPILNWVPNAIGTKVALVHRHDNFPGGSDLISAEYGTVVEQDRNWRTFGALARASYRKAGSSISLIRHIGWGNGGECVGYAAYYGERDIPWSDATFPAGMCVYAPPGRDWCNIITPTVTFEHGRVSVSANSNVKANIDVNCTAPMNVRLVFGEDALRLGSNTTAKLSIPSAVNGRLALKSGSNQVPLLSELNTINEKPGDYQASTVVYVTYY